jgi:hypothetical protein
MCSTLSAEFYKQTKASLGFGWNSFAINLGESHDA